MASFFQSLSSFFAPRRDGPRAGSSRQALSYTHDAFTLPTHSPTTSHLDAAPNARGPSAFSYPPATPGTSHDDAFTPFASSDRLQPSSSSSSNQPNSLLPMYAPRSASLAHPPLDKTWERIRTWLTNEYPELGDTLNYGILPEALGEIELNLGVQLPRAVRESYLVVDGQEAESSAGCSEGLFFGLTFLPLEDVLDEWRFWREVDEDPTTGANPALLDNMHSIPDGWIRRQYSCRGWIPLVTDRAGNYIGIDLTPPPHPINPDGSEGVGGSPGQVIVFGRDFDTKIVLWRGDGESGRARWLASFAEELESGEGFEVRGSENDKDGSDDDSEDSIGYEGYFSSGLGGGKGGDAGSGGSMRFTGEYKGWSAIEVWADRSYKRWHAAGLIPDEEEEAPATAPVNDATMVGESALPVLVTAPVQSTTRDDDMLDSATPTALVAPSQSSHLPPAASESSTLTTSSTLSSAPSATSPLLPPPTASKSTTDSEDLMSLASPGPSSWTAPTSTSSTTSRPPSQPPTTLPAPLVPTSPTTSTFTAVSTSPSTTLVDASPPKADIEPPAPSSTIRLVGSKRSSEEERRKDTSV